MDRDRARAIRGAIALLEDLDHEWFPDLGDDVPEVLPSAIARSLEAWAFPESVAPIDLAPADPSVFEDPGGT